MTPAFRRIAPSLKTASARVAVAVATLLLGLVYAATLLPAVHDAAGFSAALDGWLNGVFRAGVIAVLVMRGFADRNDRVTWWLLRAALLAALLGTLGYYLHYQYQDPVPYPSLSTSASSGSTSSPTSRFSVCSADESGSCIAACGSTGSSPV